MGEGDHDTVILNAGVVYNINDNSCEDIEDNDEGSNESKSNLIFSSFFPNFVIFDFIMFDFTIFELVIFDLIFVLMRELIFVFINTFPSFID